MDATITASARMHGLSGPSTFSNPTHRGGSGGGERLRKKNAAPVWHRVRRFCQRLLLLVVALCGYLRSSCLFACPWLLSNGSSSSASPLSPRAMSSRASRDITPLDPRVAAEFPDNTVINSRYTIFNFIFKNLYEQFRRPLNFYFLLVAMLQFISIIAPVNPMSTVVPLLFAFSLTAVKEGYDDLKRHRQDTAYNTKKRLVLDRLSGEWRQTMNCQIRVGDVMLLQQNEEIPCDCLVLAAPSSSVFIRTDNLDGEIDLKPRDVVAPPVEPLFRLPTPSPQTVDDDMIADSAVTRRLTDSSVPAQTFFSLEDDGNALLEKLSCLRLQCPPANPIMDAFDGVAEFTRRELVSSPVRLVSLSAAYSSGDGGGAGGVNGAEEVVRISLSHRHLLLQSCLLKNAEKAVCVAVYTGNDTKCGMNKRPPPVKWAEIDKHVSKYSVFIFCCQMISAMTFGIIGYVANQHVQQRHWYLPQHATEKAASFLIYPLRFFLLTTVMIPVSFKFVVDMSKYYMALAVEWDQSMMHGSLEGCKVNNTSILEDLGQIDYVLSDKTGTMTQNVMQLQSISVAPDVQVNLAEVDLPSTVFASPIVARDYALGVGTASGRGPLPYVPMHGVEQSCEVQHFASMLALCNTVEVTPVSMPIAEADLSSSVWLGDEAVLYQAASPDEVALCCGTAKLDVVLHRRTLHEAVLRIGPSGAAGCARSTAPTTATSITATNTTKDETWLIHHVFLFSSERKSMGVIVEHKKNKRILVVVKGADESVARMLKGAPGAISCGDAAARPLQQPWQETYPAMAQQLSSYAKKGLRTLLVAQRVMERRELNQFLTAVRQAELAMDGRQAKVDALRAAIETDLDLIGITAIEDKLQEQVQETIGDVLSAGMMMWMLTGDKVETAEQIGLSCGLFTPQDQVIRIVEGDTEDTRDQWEEVLMRTALPHGDDLTSTLLESPSGAAWGAGLSKEEKRRRLTVGRRMIQRVRTFGLASGYGEETAHPMTMPCARTDSPPDGGVSPPPPPRSVLIVQGGRVLERILTSPHLAARFGDLSRRCVSVICARATPSQKAMVTHFVRQQGKMTLSIGDGGNDVAMIQEAHVGVGIVGKEGQQAARAADFAITQFSDLRHLMFVHGQQAYVRTAYVIKYSFYKSMLISFIQLAYNAQATYFSGGTFWNSFSLTMWNGVYTLPQTLFYCLDRFAPRVVLERCPALYKEARRAVDMDVKEFFGWYVVRGIVQSIGLLLLVTQIFGRSFAFRHRGHASSNDVTFTVAYTALILSQMFTVFLESHSVTWLNLLWLLGMPAFYLATALAYSDVPQLQYFNVLRKTLACDFWLAAIAVAVTLTAPVLILQGCRACWHPNPRDVLRSGELARQRVLLKQRSYRSLQSVWVRFFGCTPEAPSPSLVGSPTAEVVSPSRLVSGAGHGISQASLPVTAGMAIHGGVRVEGKGLRGAGGGGDGGGGDVVV